MMTLWQYHNKICWTQTECNDNSKPPKSTWFRALMSFDGLDQILPFHSGPSNLILMIEDMYVHRKVTDVWCFSKKEHYWQISPHLLLMKSADIRDVSEKKAFVDKYIPIQQWNSRIEAMEKKSCSNIHIYCLWKLQASEMLEKKAFVAQYF